MNFVFSAETRSHLFQAETLKTFVARLIRIHAELDEAVSFVQPQGGTSSHRERRPPIYGIHPGGPALRWSHPTTLATSLCFEPH